MTAAATKRAEQPTLKLAKMLIGGRWVEALAAKS